MSNESRLRSEKEKAKLEKIIGPTMVAELEHMSNKELEDKLLALAKYEYEIITAKNNDEELLKAKEHVKFLNAPYRESLKDNKAKSRFIGVIMEERKEVTGSLKE